REVAIKIADGGDGTFDRSDSVIFYGESVDRWLYREGFNPSYITNVYTDRNVYWLSVTGGLGGAPIRMGTADAAVSGQADTVIEAVASQVHAEEDKLLLKDASGHTDNYYNWYWTNNTNLDFYIPSPGAVTGAQATLSLVGRTGGLSYMDVYVNGAPASDKNCSAFGCSFSTTALTDGLNQIDLSLTPDGSTPPYFDYLNVTYSRRLAPSDDRLDFVTNNIAQTAEFRITDQFSSTPMLLDISDPLAPVQLTGFSRDGGGIAFERDLSGQQYSHYHMATLATIRTPESLERVSPTDLRAAPGQADLIVVTAEALAPYLADYKEYRESGGYSVRVVTIDDIMDNFSYGVYDPAAIRDFLKFAYETYPSPAPSAVLFVGDANYDYRNVLGTNVPNLVPVFIHPYEGLDITYSDDNYVYFGRYGILDSDTSLYRAPDRGLDMISARWPVRNAEELRTVVNKIKDYESPSNFGIWRTRITLVADDEFGGNFDNETFHTTQTEQLDSTSIPRVYTRDKIYLWDYPFVNREKPAVNEAIINSLNEGSLIINYVGHGNPDVWAHEHVLRRASDLPRLHNYDQLTLVFAASCAIGFFDDPEREGMGETFLTMSSGGAIGVVSATRLVYSSPNASFNRDVYQLMLDDEDLSICQAVYTAKLMRQYVVTPTDTTILPRNNDRAYVYFGDPFLRLGTPSLRVEFDEAPDSLIALNRTRVSGRVVDRSGSPLLRDGKLLVAVYDSQREKMHRVGSQEIEYKITGPRIYRGSATIENGSFELEFVPPLDVGYGGKGARVLTYAMFDSTDAVGLVDSVSISKQITVSSDSTGPAITYGFAGRSNFLSGDLITRNESLQLRISDSSGINLSGGLGHGISLEIDGRSDNTIMLTDYFEYDQDDFTAGGLTYPSLNLEPGQHQFKIKAWDNANNSSTVEFSVEVVASTRLAINELLNYPNPMNERTTFYFELTQPASEFSLEIFTLSGKKIRSFNQNSLPADNYPNSIFDLEWDGRDADGDRVATGVYIYKAAALPSAGGDRVESFGKIVVIN
ncbi:MAG: type IX secretion system sortase PorU, partial [Candidatus Zixiibacteriota bacterium]